MIRELSIIIPTLNEEKYLANLLQSIAKQDYTGKVEVLLIDGHSTDNTIRKAKEFQNQIADLQILTAERGIGNQRNVGAEKAHYAYLLFIDADVVLPKNCLRVLAGKHVSKHFVAAALHIGSHMSFLDVVFLVMVYFFFFLALLIKIPPVNGDFLFTTRENHKRIHGFSEDTTLGEDVDYGLRSLRNGAKYYFFFRPFIFASDRRAKQMGRFRLLLLWSKSFLYVSKHGPIAGTKQVHYPYGHYT